MSNTTVVHSPVYPELNILDDPAIRFVDGVAHVPNEDLPRIRSIAREWSLVIGEPDTEEDATHTRLLEGIEPPIAPVAAFDEYGNLRPDADRAAVLEWVEALAELLGYDLVPVEEVTEAQQAADPVTQAGRDADDLDAAIVDDPDIDPDAIHHDDADHGDDEVDGDTSEAKDPAERPKGNASRADWAAYAANQGFPVGPDDTRDDIRDLFS